MDSSVTSTEFEHNPKYIQSILDGTSETITTLYASGDSNIKSPKDAAKANFEKSTHHLRSKIKHEFCKHEFYKHEMTQEEMDAAAKYGRFPQRPSDLFLKVCIY